MVWIDLLESLAVLVAAGVAIYGINSWRREHSGKRKMELAEDTLALFYEAADAIRHIRHPAAFSNEFQDFEKGERESERELQARKNASVVFVRYQRYQETFNKIHSMRYRFMALIGKDKAAAFDDLRNIIIEIHSAASNLARLWPHDEFKTEKEFRLHRERIEKHEAVFWDSLGEDDKINPRIEAMISEIESVCRPEIQGAYR